MQKINLQKSNNIKSISVYGKSNVYITCTQIIPKCYDINLFKFNDSSIRIENKCCFNSIKTFSLNKSGLLAYKPELSNHVSIISRKLNDDRQCYHDLNIYLSKKLQISCESEFDIELLYDQLEKYSFSQYGNSITFHNISTNDINISNVISSLKLHEKPNLIFNDFLDGNAVLTYSNLFQLTYKNLFITINWDKYIDVKSLCPWENTINSNHEFIVKEFDNLTQNSYWRKACFNSVDRWIGYLYYRDHAPPGELIIIPKFTLIQIIIASVCAVVFFVSSFIAIALCRLRCTKFDPDLLEPSFDSDYDSDDNNNNNNNNNGQQTNDNNNNKSVRSNNDPEFTGIPKSIQFDPGYNEGIPKSIQFDSGYNEGIPKSIQFDPGYNEGIPKSIQFDPGYNEGIPKSIQFDPGYNEGIPKSLQFDSDYEGWQRTHQFDPNYEGGQKTFQFDSDS